MSEQLISFVPFPRDALDKLRNGTLKPAEFSVWAYVRLHSNPWGKASISLENIRNDILGNVSVNYCNKLLLSLKRKGFLHYEDRSGRRGSFDVFLPDIRTPNRTITHLPNTSEQESVRGKEATSTSTEAESGTDIPSVSQSFTVLDITGDIAQKRVISIPPVRGSNNDTDKNKYKDRFDSLKRGSIPVEGFIPSNEGERLCHVIALEIDESYMDFLLSVLRKDGDEFLRRALNTYRFETADKEPRNPAAYFNKVVQKLRALHK